MEGLAGYRAAIKRVIQDYAQFKPSIGDIEIETVFDEKSDHYEMLYIGWEGPRRVHGTVIHIDIRDGKVWIHYDGTHDGVAEDLVAAGVPRDHIVIGWHAPELREHTAYARA